MCFMRRCWLDGVLPMVRDVESSIQSKCTEVIGSVIFNNLVAYNHSSSEHHRMAWSLLDFIADSNNTDHRSVGNCNSLYLSSVVVMFFISCFKHYLILCRCISLSS